MRRLLLAHKQQPDDWTVLDRLAVVGRAGMGALTYRPQQELSVEEKNDNLDELAEACQKILNTEYSDKLDELYRLGVQAEECAPKIMTQSQGRGLAD